MQELTLPRSAMVQGVSNAHSVKLEVMDMVAFIECVSLNVNILVTFPKS